MHITINRKDIIFSPDFKRIITRFSYSNDIRSKEIIRKVLSLKESDAKEELVRVYREFSKRHRSISKIFQTNYNRLSGLLREMNIVPEEVEEHYKVLIGSYFTKEYSIESSAFFNPSIVEDPDQRKLERGEKRVILSFRATGEGHISSIVFRGGILDSNNNLKIAEAGKMLNEAEIITRYSYNKESFIASFKELRENNTTISSKVFSKLADNFSYNELEKSVKETKKEFQLSNAKELLLDEIMWLASSHYDINFSIDTAISERVIFPVCDHEQNGVEDARFVRFTEDNGEVIYYATYTAYDGFTILPKLIITKDFYHFEIKPLHGEVSRNKGMALFPRKIKGKYVMLARIDGINNYISFSDKINMWRKAKLLQEPKYPWEFIQIGNCGSPIETKDGWLVITHAVGPMREYVLGASLFDLDNPEKEIGRLKTPLMTPNELEREGYVPNVIYSCGSIVHNGMLGIPYSMSDYSASFASIDLEEILTELKSSK